MQAEDAKRAATFRPDIDGLRAVAIGAVLLYHFDLLGARGGFVGVDVFFVISGYLMTGMLMRSGSIAATLVPFYRRRFWRIAPAYFFTIAVTLAIGAVLMLPVDVERLGMSALAAALFVPNFFFSAGAGYFDTAAIYKPLLHTWSLGVEMQFYLVWPFLVMLVRRAPVRWQVTALAAIFLLSFVFCQIFAIADPKVAFFTLPARLWEFALGGLAAQCERAGVGARVIRIALPLRVLSLVVLLIAPWLAGEGDAWPAPWALPACIATAALILIEGRGDAVAGLLSARPMTFIGRISYSLYLVHWPVVVFVGYRQFPEASLGLRLVALAACVPLAMALYHGVEAPMRRFGRSAVVPGWTWAALAGALVVSVGGGFAVHRLMLSRLAADAPLESFSCAPLRTGAGARSFCVIGNAQRPATAVLWGDSHAMHLVPGFAALLARRDGAMLFAAKDACPPVPGLNRVSNRLSRRDDCRRVNAAVFEDILAMPSIGTVVLAARWPFYGETTRFGAEKGSPAYLVSAESRALSVAASQHLLEVKMTDEVDRLTAAGKRVVIVAPTPEMGFDAGRCALMLGADACNEPRADVDARQAFVASLLARLSAHPHVRIADPKDVLCDAAACHGGIDGEPAFRDDNHLTALAAQRVVGRLFGGDEAL